MANILSVSILLRLQIAWEPLIICHWFVNRGRIYGEVGLSIVERDTHLEVRLMKVNRFMTWACGYHIIVGIGTFFVTSEREFFRLLRIYFISYSQLVEHVLRISLKKLGLWAFQSHLLMSLGCQTLVWSNIAARSSSLDQQFVLHVISSGDRQRGCCTGLWGFLLILGRKKIGRSILVAL